MYFERFLKLRVFFIIDFEVFLNILFKYLDFNFKGNKKKFFKKINIVLFYS